MSFSVNWNEDSSATILARITAREGSGEATGIDGEGNWLEQADVDSIVCKIFDLDSDTPNTPTETLTLTVSEVVLDTPVTTNVIWTKDTIGYNFVHDVEASAFPVGGHRYRLEYIVTLEDGTVFHGVFNGSATPIYSS